MHSREFLSLSDELSQRESEACWRTAVSRAYYAAFHRTRDFLEALGFQTRQSDQAHAGVYRRLSGANVRELSEAARCLMALRRLRNEADYDLILAFPKTESVDAGVLAKMAFTFLDRPRDAAELNAITETIRTYERNVLREVTWRNL